MPDILSESVSKALLMTGGSEASQTAKFVEMMDKFFDSLNVTSFERGKRQRKPFQQLYRSSSDIHLKVQSFSVHVHVHVLVNVLPTSYVMKGTDLFLTWMNIAHMKRDLLCLCTHPVARGRVFEVST